MYATMSKNHSIGHNFKTTDLDAAIKVIQKWINIRHEKRDGDIQFVDFLKKFWSADSEYFKSAEYEGRHLAALTLKNNQGIVLNYVEKYFKGMTLSDIDEDNLNDFFRWCTEHPQRQRSLSTGALKKIKTCVVVPLRWARQKKIITHVIDFSVVLPCLGSARIYHRGILTEEEQHLLVNHKWKNQKAYLAFFIAINCGLRLGEIRALTVADVTPSFITVNKSYNYADGLKSTKTGKSRIVPCTLEVYTRVREYIQTLPLAERQDDCLIFANENNKSIPINENYCTHYFYNEMERLGIKRVRINPENGMEETICFHSLRHQCATRWISSGIDARRVAKAMGHSIRMLQNYSDHFTKKEIETLGNELSQKGLLGVKAGMCS